MPGAAIEVFQVAGEERGVHERRGLHALAERGAEHGEPREVGGERGGDLYEFVRGVGDEFFEVEIGELAEAGARDCGSAGEGDDGDAHPEGVETGGVAVVGNGVEGDVDVVVEGEVIGAGAAGVEGDAGGVDVEGLLDAGAGGAFGGEEVEAGVGEGVEDVGPEMEGGWGDFAEVVEAAEGDLGFSPPTVLERGEGVDEGFGGEGVVAPEGVGEVEGGFRVDAHTLPRAVADGGLFLWWVEMGVGEAVVDLGEAGGAGVGEPGELEGGGFLGEGAEAVVGHVHGDVDEDVDAVGADFLRELGVGELGDVVEVVGVLAELVGDGVGAGGVGIDRDFELGAVVVFQERESEEGLAVVVEVGAEIPDVETTTGCNHRGHRGHRDGMVGFLCVLCVLCGLNRLRPGGVFGVDRFGSGVFVVVEGVEEAALGGGVAPPQIECDGAAVGGEGFGEFGAGFVGVAEVEVEFADGGVEGDGGLEGGDGFVEVVGEEEGVAEVGVSEEIAGGELGDALEVGDGVGGVAELEVGEGEVVVGGVVIGVGGEEMFVEGDGSGGVAELVVLEGDGEGVVKGIVGHEGGSCNSSLS